MSDIVLRNVAPPKDDDILSIDIYSDGKARCYSWSEKWIDAEVIDSKPPTNVDRIRGMTDEELAKWLCVMNIDDCPDKAHERHCTDKCYECKGGRMTVDILGAQWTLVERAEADDATLSNCDGYCDWTARLIVIEREMDGNLDDMEKYIRKVKRHEIIHAFLFECGLAESTMSTQAWSQNEEMVDWLARLGGRIYKAWKDAGAVEVDE